MKKFGLQLLIILVLGAIAQHFLPFWSITVVAALVGFFFKYENSAASFAAGTAAVTLLWSSYAGFLNTANAGQLAGQIGQVFKIGQGYLIPITGLIGGLLGGLGAQTGTLARKLFEKEADVVA
ncbi:MAG: hypothetical protein K9J37_00745 [Saprospiraceae bacterium]|nr:hypothetical protein [Saprospiraceae bacterium]MCF8248402.1 hypothetical protein [Saprospiraceae bacterium]MCF8280073.1 hypothetical protein [Bacteroidales bacterium]MCF8309930.1 hypothetical protein [Saprospiraceae bacterium]MCF8438739.1 hypothetical protein [Saprospiraceae bacterium]